VPRNLGEPGSQHCRIGEDGYYEYIILEYGNQASPVILLRTNEVVDLQIFQDLLSASYLSLKW
jgi:hypothetical protein